MASPATHIRPATSDDRAALGRLGALLLRLHHDLDAQRFIPPGDDPEGGYAWFLGTQLERRDACVLVAEHDGAVVGYVYASVEPHDWSALRDRAGFVHDLLVLPQARGRQLGSALLDAALAWLAERDVPRVVLWTAHGNAAAERLFARHGFRRTMTEMTREL